MLLLKKRAFVLLLLALMVFSFNSAFAEGLPQIGDTTTSLQDGYMRHPFANGYTGFCISYGTPDAENDDVYEVISPDGLSNARDQKVTDFFNYLKVFATQYPDKFLNANEVFVQHTVWHFSDNFNGWRLEDDLIDEIKRTAAKMKIPDRGYSQRIGNTVRTWDFIILAEKDTVDKDERALFFAYKMTEEPVADNPVLPDPDAPVLNGINLPRTGDESGILLCAAALAASIAGITVLTRKKKEA